MRQMLGWAFEPADDAMLLFLIQKGKRDARSWAVSNGLQPKLLQTSASLRASPASGVLLP